MLICREISASLPLGHLGVKWSVLVGNVGVERPPWATPVFRVDVAGALGLVAGAEVLAVR